ncbi:MAG: hypothetical protein ACLFMT_05250 [Halobacteriales archaeon]
MDTQAVKVESDVDPTACPYVEGEVAPLSAVIVGVLVTLAGVAVLVFAERPVYGLLPLALGWFLVPYGVYREAEVLESEGYLWSPGFNTIAMASLPVVGALVGAVYLVRRQTKAP